MLNLKEQAMYGNKTLGENAYINIKNFILSGKYKPGKRLQYDEVASELGISPTPLKEAFLRLEREGFVEVIARKGTYVRKLNKKDIIDSYQVREVLEGLSASLAAKRATPENIQQLKKNLERLEKSIKKKDSQESLMLDIEFHETIARIAGNNKLLDVYQHNMVTNIYAIAGVQDLYIRIGQNAVKNHRAVIEAIEEKSSTKAEKVMKGQMREAAEFILNDIPESVDNS